MIYLYVSLTETTKTTEGKTFYETDLNSMSTRDIALKNSVTSSPSPRSSQAGFRPVAKSYEDLNSTSLSLQDIAAIRPPGQSDRQSDRGSSLRRYDSSGPIKPVTQSTTSTSMTTHHYNSHTTGSTSEQQRHPGAVNKWSSLPQSRPVEYEAPKEQAQLVTGVSYSKPMSEVHPQQHNTSSSGFARWQSPHGSPGDSELHKVGQEYIYQGP